MKIQTALFASCAAVGMAAFSAQSVSADIDPGSIFPTVTAVSGGYQYLYPVDVEENETVAPGSFFTFFDVQGLVAGSEFGPNADWSSSSALTGPEAMGTFTKSDPLVDSASIPNVTFTYNGTAPLTGFQPLGDFGFVSTDPQGTTPEGFTAIAQVTGTTTNNSNATFYEGPTAAVPEANVSTLFAFGGIGLLGLGLRTRISRRIRTQ